MTAAQPAPLLRRLLAEFLGTGLLMTAVIGSGIAVTQLSPHGDLGLQLLENAIATGLALTALILMLGPISGAHFNPLVSAADWLLGRSAGHGLTLTEVGAYTVAQVAGGIGGALLSNVMFDVRQGFSTHRRATGAHFVSEIVATAVLIALIFALARTHRGALAAPAVGAVVAAGYFFTSSTFFANIAADVPRMFSDTFAGIAPSSIPAFVGAQLIGLLVGVGTIRILYPDVATAADDVVPHHAGTTHATEKGTSRAR
ncbi:MAG TPA: aquaporin [Jatrophihabitans sp.]|uniref:aquaporin n=1 Tax=Jatrophihabitans sp. TaxID=1932789 RepID=UPI002E01EB63|nr:aquaporin [Jatrophihabitans sp.]